MNTWMKWIIDTGQVWWYTLGTPALGGLGGKITDSLRSAGLYSEFKAKLTYIARP